jgi:hypothetical protein
MRSHGVKESATAEEEEEDVDETGQDGGGDEERDELQRSRCCLPHHPLRRTSRDGSGKQPRKYIK